MISFQLPSVNVSQANYMTAQLDTIPDDVAVLGIMLNDPSMWCPWEPVSIIWFAAEEDLSTQPTWYDDVDVDWHSIETDDPLVCWLDAEPPDTDSDVITWR